MYFNLSNCIHRECRNEAHFLFSAVVPVLQMFFLSNQQNFYFMALNSFCLLRFLFLIVLPTLLISVSDVYTCASRGAVHNNVLSSSST